MYGTSYLEDYIIELYNDIGIHRPDELNKYLIADQLNIGVYLVDGHSEAIYQDGRYYIFLDRYHCNRKRWQDFGHELCHVLRHEGHQRNMSYLFRELQEWQADNFMYHFCVPTFMLQRIRLPTDWQCAARLIAHEFNVELEFAIKRLERYARKQMIAGIGIK